MARTPTLERPLESPAEVRGRAPQRRSAPAVAAVSVVILVVVAAAVFAVLDRTRSDDLTQPAEEPPAEAIWYGEEPRANWVVAGIAAGDDLNIHSRPGEGFAVTATLSLDAPELESTGRIARVDNALWREIVVRGAGVGWANPRYLAEPLVPAPRIDYGAEPRANWVVAGLPEGDELNVRTGPGVRFAVMATLSLDAPELESTGRTARAGEALWREVVVPGDGVGWVNARYLAEPPPPVLTRYGQEPRANWDVTGVATDDVLNVRSGPGAVFDVVETLPPSAAELESTGRIAYVGGTLWREVVVPGDGVGWVNARYLTET